MALSIKSASSFRAQVFGLSLLCLIPSVSIAQDAAVVPESEQQVEQEVLTPSPNPDESVQTSEDAGSTGQAETSDVSVQGDAAVPPPADVLAEPDSYFDSGELAPGPAVTQSTAPTMVDPSQTPAQKYIVVKKNSPEGSYESSIVAANRALKLGRYASAMDMFGQLYKTNPRDPRVLMGLAVSQQHSGLSSSAIKTYEELLKRDPNNQEALVNMLGLVKDQYPEVALRRLMELREKFPNHPGVAAQIGLTAAELGQAQEALRYLGIASSMEPDNAGHFFNMAIISDQNGMKEEAVRLYEQALQVDAMYGASRSIPREKVYDRLAVLRRL